MELPALLLLIGFGSLIGITFLVVAIAFVTFRRMNREVRRARMYLLGDRFDRFLGAFTLAFMVLTVSLGSSILGFPLPAGVSATIVFVFFGAILYGALEIFFVLRPRPHRNPRMRSRTSALPAAVPPGAQEESDAPK